MAQSKRAAEPEPVSALHRVIVHGRSILFAWVVGPAGCRCAA
jgi:hypothetical protein